jgi:transmembrane sensor
MDTPQQDLLLEEAARWYARLAAPLCSPAERTQFDLWRESSPLHVEAWARLERASDTIEHLATSDARLQALSDRAYALGRAASDETSRPHRRWAVPATLAASLVMVLVGLRLASQVIWQPAHSLAYDNASGLQRRITLEDGSVVHMDANSRITVLISPKQRRVELLGGRVLFEVTHDATRPFSVIAGSARTTDLGTRFQVDRTREGVVVTLAEGSVVVNSTLSAQSWQEQLSPGEQLAVSSNASSHVRRAVDPLAATSWSRGRLVFRATPLGQAVDEVNRYTEKKLRVADPSLAELTVSGTVVAGNGELAASAFAAVLPIHVVDGGSETILFPGRADSSP